MIKLGLSSILVFLFFISSMVFADAKKPGSWIENWRGCFDFPTAIRKANEWAKTKEKQHLKEYCNKKSGQIKVLKDWTCEKDGEDRYCQGEGRIPLKCRRHVQCPP